MAVPVARDLLIADTSSTSRGGCGRGTLTAPGEAWQADLKKIPGYVYHPGQKGFLPACVQHPRHHICEGGGKAH